MATLSPEQPGSGRAHKRGFAKAARKFAKRAAALPGLAMLATGGAAAIALATITGAFGTIGMPLGERLGFWTVLIGWNMVKWQAWFTWRVKAPRDWPRAAAIGAVVVNLPLPLEIPLALWLFGRAAPIDPGRTWIEAGAISAVLFVILHFSRRRSARSIAPGEDGILFRAGVRDPDLVHGVRAEDHYCRIHLAGGQSLLVLARFADMLAELAAIDGEQVHRGAWVATAGVDGAVRDGRAWRLVLADGTRLPVSASYAAAVRARGWLRMKPTIQSKSGVA